MYQEVVVRDKLILLLLIMEAVDVLKALSFVVDILELVLFVQKKGSEPKISEPFLLAFRPLLFVNREDTDVSVVICRGSGRGLLLKDAGSSIRHIVVALIP